MDPVVRGLDTFAELLLRQARPRQGAPPLDVVRECLESAFEPRAAGPMCPAAPPPHADGALSVLIRADDAAIGLARLSGASGAFAWADVLGALQTMARTPARERVAVVVADESIVAFIRQQAGTFLEVRPPRWVGIPARAIDTLPFDLQLRASADGPWTPFVCTLILERRIGAAAILAWSVQPVNRSPMKRQGSPRAK